MSLHYIKHLEHFIDDHISTVGRTACRPYLRRCLAMWAETYGPDFAARLENYIRRKLASGT